MVVVDLSNCATIVDKLVSEPVLSLDCETSGLSWTDRPFLAILATGSEEYLFPLPQFAEFVNKITSSTQHLIFQNAKFDMRMLKQVGISIGRFSRVYDLTLMARLHKNNHFGKKAYSLAEQAARNKMQKLDTGLKDYIKEHDLYELRTNRLGETAKQPRYDWVPKEVMYPYAAMDARITYDLYMIYKDILDPTDFVVLDNECAGTKVCFDMEYNGIRVDLDYTMGAREAALASLDRVKLEFRASTGIEFQDSKGVLVPIFEAAGEKFFKTPSGQPRLIGNDLERFTSPVAKIVQNIREQQKLISTYYDNYINLADSEGFIHPTMWQGGTRTGRFSYSDPNLQNIPKEEDATSEFVVRGCFVPRPGRIFASMDYAQQEYRLMLAYADQRDLIDAVMAGADVHQATADLVGITRSQAKTLNFAILYGAGPAKVALMLGITKAEAQELISKYFSKLRKVEILINRVTTAAKQRGYLNNWFGRKLRFGWVTYKDPDTGKVDKYHDAYTGPNHLIQSGGADIIKKAMVEMRPFIDQNCFPVLQVHDQLLFDVSPNSYGSLKGIADAMEKVFPEKNGMRMKVDVTWSPKSFAERDMLDGYPC